MDFKATEFIASILWILLSSVTVNAADIILEKYESVDSLTIGIFLVDQLNTQNLTLTYNVVETSNANTINLQSIDQNYTISNLQNGVTVNIVVNAVISGFPVEITDKYQIKLDAARNIQIFNITGDKVYFVFDKPNGFYETIKAECVTLNNVIFSTSILSQNDTNGVCSNYTKGDNFNIKLSTIKTGFTSYYRRSVNAAPILDCTYTFYDPETNTLGWADVRINGYFFQLFLTSTAKLVFNMTTVSPQYAFKKLAYSTNFTAMIMPVVWNIVFNSGCSYEFESHPCPALLFNPDVPIEIADLTDQDTVSIRIGANTFQPDENILYYAAVVETKNNCTNKTIPQTFDENCFIAQRFALTNESDYFLVPLSKETNCKENICNFKFEQERSYFVTVRAYSDCAMEESNTLLLKIEKPFPIPLAVGLAVGLALFIVFVGIVILLIVKHCRKPKKAYRAFNDSKYPKSFNLDKISEKIASLSKDSNQGFSKEFEMIENISPKCGVRDTSDPRMLLDRYINISADGAFERTRIKLSSTNDYINASSDDYINANYVSGLNNEKEYIASQGPLPNTVNDFWRMIYEQNVDFIVMLTTCVDKFGKKCEKYWPDLNETAQYGDLTITTATEIKKQDYTVRFFKFTDKANKMRVVTQYQYINWDDYSTPDSILPLLGFIKHLRVDIKSKNSRNPILVHCSAGVGRTGTFIAIDRLLLQLENGFHEIDIFGTVTKIRLDRYMLVQTEEQYILIYRALEEYQKQQENFTSISF